MENKLDKEREQKMKDALLNAATDGKLDCPTALKIAETLKVDPKLVGEACNELKIKLYGCALGCF